MSLHNDKATYLAGKSTSGFASGALLGSVLGSAIPVVGTIAGAVIGGILGTIGSAIFGALGWDSEKQAERDNIAIARNETQEQRNSYIRDARMTISNTRANIDSTYGEGTFAEFNDLFASIFGMDSSSSTSAYILSKMSTDKKVGKIEDSILGISIDEISGGSMSLGDIASNYKEYLRGMMSYSDTAFGIQMRAYDNQEMNLISSYESGIDNAIYTSAKQFSDAFLQQRSTAASNISSLAQAQNVQASSGIRQEGSGQNISNLQKFSNDLSDIAYASLLDYGIKAYEKQMSNAQMTFGQQMDSIRTSKSISSTQALSSIIQSYNQYNSNMSKYASEIYKSEQAINEANSQLKEYDDVLGGHSKYDDTMEDYFG